MVDYIVLLDKLIHAAGCAATNYANAAYYKTDTASYFEGKAKGLLNFAADIGLGDNPDIRKYREMVDKADEIISN